MNRFSKVLAITVIASLVLAILPLVQASPVQAAGPPWIKYAGNVTLEFEEYVINSWVIKDGTTYRMWYSHAVTDMSIIEMVDELKESYFGDIVDDIANQDINSLLNHLAALSSGDVDDLLDFLSATRIIIGYATSTNGVTWTIVEDEALAGGGQLWDSVGAPCVIKDSGTYKMWYTRAKANLSRAEFEDILSELSGDETARKAAILDLLDSVGTVIGYAESVNGEDWTVENPEVLGSGGTALSSVEAPCVIRNDTAPLYEMWYTHGKADLTEVALEDYLSGVESFDMDDVMDILNVSATVIGYATSGDGESWTVVEADALPGDTTAWDSAGTPTVVKTGSSYEMWYTHIETGLTEADLEEIKHEIGELHLADFVSSINPADLTEFLDDLAALDISRLKELLSDTATVIGYATSSDGENWTVADAESLVGVSSNLWSSVGAPCVIKEDSNYKMWYTKGIPDLTVDDLLDLLMGEVLPIGYAYYTPGGGGGGGGGFGGGGDLVLEVTMEDEESYYFISTAGRIKEFIDITSEDGRLNVFVQKGTIVLDEDGDPLTRLEFTVDEMPPPPPADAEILGLPYNFEPDGATFNPLITVTWGYDPSDIPGGVAEEDLRIAYYDEGAGECVVIPAEVDPLTNTITAYIGHLTNFAIIAYAAPPPPLPLPAAFTVGSLIVSPPEVNTGKTVSINALVTNIGETAGSYTVTLEINGEIEAAEEITLSAGASETVTFTTARDEAGTYLVDINGITGSFAVAEEPPPPPPPAPSPAPPARPSRWLIIGIIAAVAAAIAIPLTLRWRERRY